MILLEQTLKIKATTEQEAQNIINDYRAKQGEEGYMLKKASFEHKTKKSKDEGPLEAYVVTITKTFCGIWEDV